MQKKYLKKERTYQNPFYEKKKKGSFTSANKKMNWRLTRYFLEFLCLVGGFIYLFYFSPIFKISSIEVIGAKRASQEEIKRLVLEKGASQMELFKDSIFLFNEQSLEFDSIKEVYSLEVLSVTKKLPKTLVINIKEKENFAIWKVGEEYFFVSEDGSIVESISSERINKGDLSMYPIIDNVSENNFNIKGKKIEEEGRVKYLNSVFQAFKQKFANFETEDGKLEIEKFILENTDSTLIAQIRLCKLVKDEKNNIESKKCQKGPLIYFGFVPDADNDFSEPLNKLFALVKTKLKDDVRLKTYLDLRYGDRVYYR